MSNHTPRFDGYLQKTRASFARQKALASLGASLGEVKPGEVEILMPFNPDFTQQHGFIHAGILSTALDSACGYAGLTLMDEHATVLSVEFKTNLFSPARGEEFLFRGKVIKSGRTITVAEATATAFEGGKDKLIATMTCTMMSIIDRPDVIE